MLATKQFVLGQKLPTHFPSMLCPNPPWAASMTFCIESPYIRYFHQWPFCRCKWTEPTQKSWENTDMYRNMIRPYPEDFCPLEKTFHMVVITKTSLQSARSKDKCFLDLIIQLFDLYNKTQDGNTAVQDCRISDLVSWSVGMWWDALSNNLTPDNVFLFN